MGGLRGTCAALCLALLAGCVSVPRQQGVAIGRLSSDAQAAALARQDAREQRLRALPGLSFSGRVALSNGRNAGSGRIEWQQSGDDYAVTLSAPVTRQSWKLSGDARSARIEGIEGGPREAADVVQLLRDSTGLDIPVGALAAWASGARADVGMFGPAKVGFDADGRLARIEQDGWTVDYLGWQEQDSGNGEPLAMPNRINAQRDPAKVRLAIDAWSWASEAP
jgi:outer membrane lipoprotein LolB